MNAVEITQDQVEETTQALRKFGRQGLEGLALWLGKLSTESAVVEKVLIPSQNPIRNEYGVGYIVTGDTLFELNKMLHNTGLRLIAQIHSHPSTAYHSEADDAYAIATREGSFSLVVPDFAKGKADINQWAIFQLKNSSWTELSHKEAMSIFSVKQTAHEPEKKINRFLWWKK